MIVHRPAAQRGNTPIDWLDSRHTFSFGGYHDQQWMGFGPLRVLNEDRVASGGGFAPHRHANMEIITYVIVGALQHADSLGNGSVIRLGDVQVMSAGSGIEHSEFNASQAESVHFLQIWIQPDRINATPRYGQQQFPPEQREGVLCLVASPDGSEGSLPIRQDARMYAGLLRAGQSITHPLESTRRVWLQLVSGCLRVNDGDAMVAGDGAGFSEQSGLQLHASADCEVLLLDLP